MLTAKTIGACMTQKVLHVCHVYPSAKFADVHNRIESTNSSISVKAAARTTYSRKRTFGESAAMRTAAWRMPSHAASFCCCLST